MENIIIQVKKFIDANKKITIIGGIGIFLLLIGLLSWKTIFVKYYNFSKEEHKFINAAKRYYEYHSQFLPKDNESKELTLQDLYDLKQIDDLYIPGSKKMCDVNSWVRVYKNESGEYKYYAYLRCGKYHSSVDHEGPKIVLNGDSNIKISVGSNYEELGVKTVNDNKDGKIKTDKVIIDKSKVNTNKIGTYQVKYTVKDSHHNKTVVTRNVNVTRSFTDTVKNNASRDGYYKGNSNNYVLFSGMLFKILKVNEDGTVKLITNDGITNLRMNYTQYKKSNVETWLNKIFLKSINSDSKKYLVKSKYCIGAINSMDDYTTYCSDTVEGKVGLLDISEYKNTFSGDSTSILSKNFALGNMIGDNYVSASFNADVTTGIDKTIISPIRPVITVNNNLSIISGDGSQANPYKLNDYNYATKKDKINTRLIGEFVEYSGLTFRIMDIDDDKNVRLISYGEWTVQPGTTTLYISTENIKNWKFDIEDDNNPAYIINNDYLDYINTKSIIDSYYDIPTNDASKKYNQYKTKKVKAKIALPKTYDLFASSGNAKYMYVYMDQSVDKTSLFMTNTATGNVFELNKDSYNSYSTKIVITVKGNLLIETGKGTVNNPYKLK